MKSNKPLYTGLDHSADEVRMITFITNHSQDDTLHCLLETFSWNDQVSAYREFNALGERQSQSDQQLLSSWIQLRGLKESTRTIQSNASPQPCQYRFTWGDYATLSYVWGNDPATETIFVNGTEMNIRPNLAAALKSIRRDHRFEGEFRLWVDAICINQSDIVERGQQVAKMKDIYSKAWNVISWIGEEARGSTKALKLLRVLSECRDNGRAQKMIQELEQNPGHLGTGCWLGLQELVIRPYWTRLWIIQELVLGCVAVSIRCGNDVIDWTTFIHGIEALHLHFWIIKDELINYDWRQQGNKSYRSINVLALHLLFKDIKPLTDIQASGSKTWTKISRLLDISASCKSVDERDKVYGMLAMMDPAIRQRIFPDYSIEPRYVFANIAIAVLEAYGNLEHLRECNMWPQQGGPTWVPDWTWPLRARDGRFRSAFKADGSQTCDFVIGKDRRTLTCQAAIVDTLDGIGGRRQTRFKYQPKTVVQPKILTSAYGGLETTRKALAHALSGDSSWDSRDDTDARMNIFNLPPTFKQGLPQFQKLGWKNAMKNEGYYYCWAEWRHANRKFLVGGRRMDKYFASKIPRGAGEKDCWVAKANFENVTTWRRFATTAKGYFGWVPETLGREEYFQVEHGDVIAIIFGCTTPLLLRRHGKNFKIVGEAYFIGLMDGEVDRMIDQKKWEISRITLI
jgi:hypothetical protein